MTRVRLPFSSIFPTREIIFFLLVCLTEITVSQYSWYKCFLDGPTFLHVNGDGTDTTDKQPIVLRVSLLMDVEHSHVKKYTQPNKEKDFFLCKLLVRKEMG